MIKPLRGDIWLLDLNPAKGHEQGGTRPALIVSVDLFNSGPAELVIVLPITTKAKGVPLHVEIKPQEAGLKEKSFIKPEDIRSVSRERLIRKIGSVSAGILAIVEDRLRILLNL